MGTPTSNEGEAVSLPFGSGNSPGFGETFSIDLNTGQSTYSVPIALPPGIAGFTPQLKLTYSSGYGYGIFGLGWRLPTRQISRRLDFGIPPSDGAPGFLERFMDGGDEIVPIEDGGFGRLVESAFDRYERQGDGWVITERNGTRHELGLSAAARVTDPAAAGRVLTWLLERSVDTVGNEIRYGYLVDDGIPYLSEITYEIYTVRISYEPRADIHVNFRAGFRRRTSQRGSKFELFVTPPGGAQTLVRTWNVTYVQAPLSDLSLLDSFSLTSHSDAGDVVRNPLRFSYQAFDPDQLRVRRMTALGRSNPPPLSEPDVELITLDNAPLPGVLLVRNGAQFYWPNRGETTWGQPFEIRQAPHVNSLARSGVVVADMDGNGTPDLLVSAGAGNLHGYYSGAGGPEWSSFVAYPRGATAEPPWSSGRVALADLDGDGKTDAVYSTGRNVVAFLNEGQSGWSKPIVREWDGAGIDFADPLVRLADMTGDGLLDLVRIRSGGIEYRPNLGFGQFGAAVFLENAPALRGATLTPNTIHLLDINGDGLSDLAQVTRSEIIVWINQSGLAFSAPVRIPIPSAPLPGTIRVADMNGCGRSGLVWNSVRGREIGFTALCGDPQALPFALTGVDHGTGLESEIGYRSAIIDLLRDRAAGVEWNTFLPFVPMVVAETVDRDTVSKRESRTTLEYRNAHFEPRNRQFEGFGEVSKLAHGDESQADVRTVYRFRLREELKPGNGPQHAALNRMQFRTEIFGLDGSPRAGRPFKTESCEHTVEILQELADGRLRVLVNVASSREENSERTDDLHVSEHLFEYDDFANVVKDTWRLSGRRNGADLPASILITDVTMTKDPTGRILDRIARMVRRDEGGKILAEVRRLYDGPDFEGLPLGQITRGLVSRIEQLAFTEADFALLFAGLGDVGYVSLPNADGVPCRFAQTERYQYDGRGLVAQRKDGIGRVTTYQYDSSGLFERSRNNGAGDVRSTFDPRTGQPTTIQYPDGSSLEMTYDAQGRLLTARLPGDAIPSRTYAYNDRNVPLSLRTLYLPGNGAPALKRVTYYDGYGHEFQIKTAMAAGQVVTSSLLRYNPAGSVRQEFEPQFLPNLDFELPNTAGRASRTFSYDALRRTVRTVNYNGGVSTAEFTPFLVTLSDANDTDDSIENRARGQFGTPCIEELDLFRQRIRITEVTGGIAAVTSFTYAPLGELLTYSDATGQMAHYTYDLTSRRTSIQHRDAGERRFWRNAAMDVIRMVDAAGTDIRFEHDEAVRLKRVLKNGKSIEEYVYSPVSIGGRSRLLNARFEGGTKSFQYSPRGDLLRVTLSIDGDAQGPVSIQYDFDDLGREIRATFPGNIVVRREYYDNGLLRKVPGFVDNITYDARGLITAIDYANSVSITYSYSAGVGRVIGQKTSGPDNTVYEDLTYILDKRERILSRQDTAGEGSKLEASYDALYQLVKAKNSGGQPDSTYEYGNGRYITSVGESGTDLTYGDVARPGRISVMKTAADPEFSIQYDANGGMIGLPGKTLNFNHRGELVSLRRADGLIAQYRYDHRGMRVYKDVTVNGVRKTTIFVDRALEIIEGSATVYIIVGKNRVAASRPGQTRFIHADYSGTARLNTDQTGKVVEAANFLPFGKLAQAVADTSVLSFELHTLDDESGLIYMGRRYYAPELASFLTPDPIALLTPERAMTTAAALLLYAYVANDPLNQYDPTGAGFWELVGAVVGVAVGVGVGASLVGGIVGGGAVPFLAAAAETAGFVAIGYIIGNRSEAGGDWEQFARGFLIGLNAGMNATLGAKVYGDVVGTALGVINIAAAIPPIAQSKLYQGILGWSNWLMPMSWIINGLGVSFFLLTETFSGFQHKISPDWETGTIYAEGYSSNAFDLGNFAFVGGGDEQTRRHEGGHNLSLAAFGTAFHLIGAIDEGEREGYNAALAYAEVLADSHDPLKSPHQVPMWGK